MRTQAILAALLVLLIGLTGCGGGGDDEPGPSATVPGPPDCVNRPELCT